MPCTKFINGSGHARRYLVALEAAQEGARVLVNGGARGRRHGERRRGHFVATVVDPRFQALGLGHVRADSNCGRRNGAELAA